MNKAELIERIIDTFTDMGSEDPVDTACANELTLPEAKMYLKEIRENEFINLEPEDRLPIEVTPELYMEAFNCYLRRCRYEVTLDRLVEFLKLGEKVDVYNEFLGKYTSATDKLVYPTTWLMENMEFPFTSYELSMLDLILIGKNSPDFDPTDDYCWYDDDNKQLHSTHHPFSDGLIDVKAFAMWILEHPGIIQYVQDWCMVNTDIDYVFRYWRY